MILWKPWEDIQETEIININEEHSLALIIRKIVILILCPWLSLKDIRKDQMANVTTHPIKLLLPNTSIFNVIPCLSYTYTLTKFLLEISARKTFLFFLCIHPTDNHWISTLRLTDEFLGYKVSWVIDPILNKLIKT